MFLNFFFPLVETGNCKIKALFDVARKNKIEKERKKEETDIERMKERVITERERQSERERQRERN